MLNKELIINQIIKAINVYPSTVTISRDIKEDDGIGGYNVIGSDEVSIVTGFINTSSSSLSVSLSDGGRVEKIEKIEFILPFSSDFELKKGDFFIKNDITYRVKNPNLQFDICYLAELEVI